MTWKLLISRLLKARAYFAERLAQWWKHSFYLYLAGLFSVFAVLDTTVLHYTSEMRQSAFDAMVRYRIVVPKPDPDIIIVDINEASLGDQRCQAHIILKLENFSPFDYAQAARACCTSSG